MSTIEDLKLRHDIKRSIRKSKSATKISMAQIKGGNKVSQELISKKFESTLKRKLKQSYESSNLKKTFNNYIDLDVLEFEFPILINGAVSSDEERADASYWSPYLLAATARETGYTPSKFHYIDGDQGMWASTREKAGKKKGKLDAPNVWKKMKNSRNDKNEITEQLQVISHSRGSAFGVAYMESLSNEIKSLAAKEGLSFAYDKNHIIEYSVNLGPHQSNSITYPKNLTRNINISHYKDYLSGDDAKGNVINIHSNALDDSGDKILEHGNDTYTIELEGVLKILENSHKSKTDQIINYYKYLDTKNYGKSKIKSGSSHLLKS
ncbi:hypothetical protein [Cellulophaga baltica]|uniref:hypothetical protein n=1 Tax=Cellulophaga baltica TaxID=76594 RepID=UPI002495683C|nr:hypothetical protein [Cellulophaga baltica]